MRKRRTSLMVAVAAAIAVVAVACGGNASPGAGPSGSASASLPAFTTLGSGTLKVASCLDFKPFESIKAGDEVGFDVDLTEEIAKRLGLTVQWVKTDFETIFTGVAAGQFDMVAAAVTATGDLGAERDEVVDFSDYYFNSRQSLTVNAEKTPDITSTDDLGEGDTVAVQKGTTGAAYAKENLEPNGVQIKTFTSAPDAFRDLEAGNVQGVINDEQATVGIIEDLPSLKLVEAIDTNEKYAFAFSPDNPGLREAVDVVLGQIIDDGTYETIFKQWFQEDPPKDLQPSS